MVACFRSVQQVLGKHRLQAHGEQAQQKATHHRAQQTLHAADDRGFGDTINPGQLLHAL